MVSVKMNQILTLRKHLYNVLENNLDDVIRVILTMPPDVMRVKT